MHLHQVLEPFDLIRLLIMAAIGRRAGHGRAIKRQINLSHQPLIVMAAPQGGFMPKFPFTMMALLP